MANPPTSPKISVNLLPPEVIMLERQAAKLSLANKFSVAMLLALVVATTATFAVRFLQNSNLNQTNQGIAYAQQQVVGLKEKEGYVVVLKDRLSAIAGLVGDNKKAALFNAVVSLAPANTQISLLSIDKSGNLAISANSASLQSLDNLVDSLNLKLKEADLIKQVDIDSLSRGRDGIYRYSLRIIAK